MTVAIIPVYQGAEYVAYNSGCLIKSLYIAKERKTHAPERMKIKTIRKLRNPFTQPPPLFDYNIKACIKQVDSCFNRSNLP